MSICMSLLKEVNCRFKVVLSNCKRTFTLGDALPRTRRRCR